MINYKILTKYFKQLNYLLDSKNSILHFIIWKRDIKNQN